MNRQIRMAVMAAACGFALAWAAPARAQAFLGRLDVTIEDASGAPLAGARAGTAVFIWP